jgi:hypothetical protein
MTAVSECEAAARDHGHTLGLWHPVDERLHASLCEVCGSVGRVMRPSGEKRWLIGGSALKQGCLEDDRGSAWGA